MTKTILPLCMAVSQNLPRTPKIDIPLLSRFMFGGLAQGETLLGPTAIV